MEYLIGMCQSSKMYTIIPKAYGQLLPLFAVSSQVRQDCLISAFLLNLVKKDVLKNVLFGQLDDRVELIQGTQFLTYSLTIVSSMQSSSTRVRPLRI